MLQVQPTASPAEIEDACATMYNKWRRLVTHHDPNVVGTANQQLLSLEAVRTTLLDPNKRAGYDAALGLNVHVGGLADPEAVLQSAAPAAALPPTPPPPSANAAPAAPTGTALWTCPKPGCGADNPPNTKFCFKCGTQLVRECPECGRTSSLVATGFCGECGYQYEIAAERRQQRADVERLKKEEEDLRRRAIDIGMERATKGNSGGNVVVTVIFGLLALMFLVSIEGTGFGGLMLALICGGVAVWLWVTAQNNNAAAADLRNRAAELVTEADQKKSQAQQLRQQLQGDTSTPESATQANDTALDEARTLLAYLQENGVNLFALDHGRRLHVSGPSLRPETMDKLRKLKPQLSQLLK